MSVQIHDEDINLLFAYDYTSKYDLRVFGWKRSKCEEPKSSHDRRLPHVVLVRGDFTV